MGNNTYIFAGGGTGGHLYPALAVAVELKQLQPEAQIVCACSDRAIDRTILAATPYAIVPQPIKPLPRRPRGWLGFLAGLVKSWKLASRLVGDLQPRAVFGLGGFAAVPVVRAAAARGIRSCLLSIDAVPGLANRLLARHAQAIFTQFQQTATCYGANAAKCRLIGCPVRRELVSAERAAAVKELGLRPDRKTLLVMAGSLGAANINQAAVAILSDLARLADAWQVLHVTGADKLAEVRAAYAELKPTTDLAAASKQLHHVLLEYCHRMDLAYAATDLVLSRAGASTIGELVAVGKPAALMPYPYHRDQQQRRNAEGMVASGSAILVLDACDATANARSLRELLWPVMIDPARLDRLAKAASSSVRNDAASQLARWLLGG